MAKKLIVRKDGIPQHYHVGKTPKVTSNADARAAFNRRPGTAEQSPASDSSRRLATAGIGVGVVGTVLALLFIFPGGVANLLGILASLTTIGLELKVTVHYAKRRTAPAEDVDWFWVVVGAAVLLLLIVFRLTGVGHY